MFSFHDAATHVNFSKPLHTSVRYKNSWNINYIVAECTIILWGRLDENWREGKGFIALLHYRVLLHYGVIDSTARRRRRGVGTCRMPVTIDKSAVTLLIMGNVTIRPENATRRFPAWTRQIKGRYNIPLPREGLGNISGAIWSMNNITRALNSSHKLALVQKPLSYSWAWQTPQCLMRQRGFLGHQTHSVTDNAHWLPGARVSALRVRSSSTLFYFNSFSEIGEVKGVKQTKGRRPA
jgi:hypothetical protein